MLSVATPSAIYSISLFCIGIIALAASNVYTEAVLTKYSPTESLQNGEINMIYFWVRNMGFRTKDNCYELLWDEWKCLRSCRRLTQPFLPSFLRTSLNPGNVL